ncbi:hypothetical protein AX17_006853 [Amanita inopinata Kibby_2008]|nr:hypothetical protein AX17_006853 [Amanita inopinata Kibby_2008]
MAVNESVNELYSIQDSPASSTSTLVLRSSGSNIEECRPEHDDRSQDQSSSAYFIADASLSPYMRSPSFSSPQQLPSQMGEGPPESSSPLLSSSSSARSSPYWPIITLAEGNGSPASFTSSTNGSVRTRSRTESLDETDIAPGLHDDKWIEYDNAILVDSFAQRLHERLLVIAHQRELSENIPSITEDVDAAAILADMRGMSSAGGDRLSSYSSGCSIGTELCTTTGFTNHTAAKMDDSPANHTILISELESSNIDTSYGSSESDLETPFFASPPLSENVTPPTVRKRRRAGLLDSYNDGKCNNSKSDARFQEIDNAHEQQKETSQNDTRMPYRMIWRAESFQAMQSRLPVPEEWEKDAPPLKRQKAKSYSHRQEFASKPASLRRAASLKSEYEYTIAEDTSVDDSEPLVPTEPVSPVSGACSSQGSCEEFMFNYGVPIIAPPRDLVARLPQSIEMVAKMRICRFLQREVVSRETDGLATCHVQEREKETVDEQILQSRQKDLWERLLNIGQLLREDVIDWLLNVRVQKVPFCSFTSFQVLPLDETQNSLSRYSSTNSTASQCSSGDRPMDLHDELSTSPETRFHAIYIFLRFFHCVMSGESHTEQVTLSDGTTRLREICEDNGRRNQVSLEEKGRKLMVWDIAIGSLALSVKFHRDFLNPFSPVYAWEYQKLAPHRLSFDDLESAQRDILLALSYDLGMAPQPLMDNLWLALPTLQLLLSHNGGWNYALKETWLRLFDAVSGK